MINKLKAKSDILIGISAIIITVSFYAFLLHNRFMPFPEGWYTYYAKCINSGLSPYRDFEYLFPPFYMYTIAFFTKFFGYDIIYLRLLGVAFYSLITIILYLSFRLCFKNWIAIVATITSALYLQTQVAEVFYDYIRFMDIFVMFTLFFFLLSIRDIIVNKKSVNIMICGIACASVILIKQNNGLILFAYILCALVFLKFYLQIEMRDFIQAFLKFFLAVIIPICLVLLLLYVNGSLITFFNSVGSDALTAKGGIKVILFNWLISSRHVPVLYKKELISTLLTFIIFFILNHSVIKIKLQDKVLNISADFKTKYIEKDWERTFDCYLLFGYAFLVSIGIFLLAHKEALALKFEMSKTLPPVLPLLIFYVASSISLILLLILLFDFYHNSKKHINLLLPFAIVTTYIAISFACGNSGGLVEGQAPIGLAFCLAIFLNNTKFKLGWVPRIGIIIICVFFSLQCIDKKLIHFYSWWNADESNYWQSTDVSNVPALHGIKLSKETKAVYDGIYEAIIYNTKVDDKIYCFPQIPLFYTLCNRSDPGVYSKVEWFDVASDKALIHDAAFLTLNNPKVILMYEVPSEAFDVHERLFRGNKVTGVRVLRDKLLVLISKKYILQGTYKANHNSLKLYLKK